MARTTYSYNEKNYQFDTSAFISIFEEYRKVKGYRYKTNLYASINDKYSEITEDVLKKWLSEKSTPNDITTVEKLAECLECTATDLLTEVQDKEKKKMMRDNYERDAIRHIYRAFVELLCAFETEKNSVTEEELDTAYDNTYKNLFPYDEPVELDECRISFDGSAYVYPQITEAAKNAEKELQIAMFDLPSATIRELHVLIYTILNDEVESQFIKDSAEKDFDLDDKAIFGPFKDYQEVANGNMIKTAKEEYYKRLFEIINPYFAYEIDSKFNVFA